MNKNNDRDLELPVIGEIDLPPPHLSNDRFLDWIADEMHWLRQSGKLEKLLQLPEARGVPFSF
jgi:hypothetical protein